MTTQEFKKSNLLTLSLEEQQQPGKQRPITLVPGRQERVNDDDVTWGSE